MSRWLYTVRPWLLLWLCVAVWLCVCGRNIQQLYACRASCASSEERIAVPRPRALLLLCLQVIVHTQVGFIIDCLQTCVGDPTAAHACMPA